LGQLRIHQGKEKVCYEGGRKQRRGRPVGVIHIKKYMAIIHELKTKNFDWWD